MNEINLPDHLIIPSIISILVLGVIFYKRKQLFKKGDWRLFWICLTVFFSIYLLIVGGATYTDISLKLNLQKFDLNKNGTFSGAEITSKLEVALKKVSSDTGRNFSFISGLIFSAIITFFVFIIGKTIKLIKAKKVK